MRENVSKHPNYEEVSISESNVPLDWFERLCSNFFYCFIDKITIRASHHSSFRKHRNLWNSFNLLLALLRDTLKIQRLEIYFHFSLQFVKKLPQNSWRTWKLLRWKILDVGSWKLWWEMTHETNSTKRHKQTRLIHIHLNEIMADIPDGSSNIWKLTNVQLCNKGRFFFCEWEEFHGLQ